MHLDSFLDVHIVVLGACTETFELGIEVVERHLNLSTSTQVSLATLVVHNPLAVVLSRDSVFVCLNKISNHVPQ